MYLSRTPNFSDQLLVDIVLEKPCSLPGILFWDYGQQKTALEGSTNTADDFDFLNTGLVLQNTLDQPSLTLRPVLKNAIGKLKME